MQEENKEQEVLTEEKSKDSSMSPRMWSLIAKFFILMTTAISYIYVQDHREARQDLKESKNETHLKDSALSKLLIEWAAHDRFVIDNYMKEVRINRTQNAENFDTVKHTLQSIKQTKK